MFGVSLLQQSCMAIRQPHQHAIATSGRTETCHLSQSGRLCPCRGPKCCRLLACNRQGHHCEPRTVKGFRSCISAPNALGALPDAVAAGAASTAALYCGHDISSCSSCDQTSGQNAGGACKSSKRPEGCSTSFTLCTQGAMGHQGNVLCGTHSH